MFQVAQLLEYYEYIYYSTMSVEYILSFWVEGVQSSKLDHWASNSTYLVASCALVCCLGPRDPRWCTTAPSSQPGVRESYGKPGHAPSV